MKKPSVGSASMVFISVFHASLPAKLFETCLVLNKVLWVWRNCTTKCQFSDLLVNIGFFS